MADPTVMDAVNAALENGGVSSEGAEDTTDEELVEGGDTGTEGGETEESEVEPEDGEESEGAEGDSADGDGDEEGAVAPTLTELAAEAEKLGISVRDKGKFKSAETLAAEIAAAKEAAPKVGKDGKPIVEKAKKEADPLNDPIDKGLKVETQQRIRTLIDRTKAAETERDTATGNFAQIIRGIEVTGTTPEQYGETLSFLQLFNSGDPVQQGQALELIESLADRLATMLGKERAVSDPLVAHADLTAAVKAGHITRALALETARLRNGTTMRTTMATDANNAQREQQRIEQVKAQGKQDLDGLEKELRASDPQYDAKLAIILPSVQAAFRRIPPNEWKAEFQRIYREAKIGFVPQRRPVPKNQPNRANKSGGSGGAAPKGGESAPTDMMGALNAALARGGK